MKYIVTLQNNIDFAPETEVAEILQNVRTILSTLVGTVPLHRDFGISWRHIDKPLPVAMVLQQAEIIDTIAEYEPRAKVVKVEYEESETEAMDGVLKPRVTVEIGEENEEDE